MDKSLAERTRERCLSFFDILGFENLVKKKELDLIIAVYKEVLSVLEEKVSKKRIHGIDSAWFSDSFIIYSKDDSKESFGLTEQASRLFFEKMLLKKIPLRGALTIGSLYTQKENNIFLGQAIIDAYNYSEGRNSQNWIGFILTPRACKGVQESDVYIDRGLYSKVNIPLRKNKIGEEVLAYNFTRLGRYHTTNLKIPLKQMQNNAEPKYRQKYENTIKFLEQQQKLKRL